MAISSHVPLRAAALGAAALIALAACGGDDDPLGGRDDGPAPSAPPPSVSISTIPEAATERTDAGAEAFVTYYFVQVVNGTYTSGDVDTLVRYSHPLCVVCRATVGDVATAFARGEVESGSVTVREVEAQESNSELTNVNVTYSVTRYVEVDPEGRNVFSSPAKNGLELLVQVQYSDSLDTWRVREIVNRDVLERRNAATASPSPTS